MSVTTPAEATLPQRLAAHPFFAGMQPHHLEVLSASAAERRFAAGEMVFRAGEPATGFYLVEQGEIAIEDSKHLDHAIKIDTVAKGEPLGWSWLFEPCTWEFDARAILPTTTLYFPREHLWEYHEEDLTLGHELYKRMSKVMVRRLQAARRQFLAERQSPTSGGAKR